MKIFKNKKVLIIGIISLILIGGVCIFLVLKGKNDNKEKRELKEKIYTMYVKINPLVKLEFKETFYECEDKDGKKYICSERQDEVTNYEMLNDDAKGFYKDIDFKGKSIKDSLIVLCDVARDNKVAFENLEITSDYTFDYEKVAQEIKDGSKYEYNFNVLVNFEEHLNEEEIIENSEEKIVTYTVTFDSKGGSEVKNQVVKKDNVVEEPEVPTKEDYEFVGWYLNNKKYDFKSSVKKDIKLVAKWKKIEKENENNTAENNTNDNNNNNNEEEKEEDSKITSTLEKINLNENILVKEYEPILECRSGGYVFANNINEVLKDYKVVDKFSSDPPYYSVGFWVDDFYEKEYASEEEREKEYKKLEDEYVKDFNDKLKLINFNEEVEQKAKKEIEDVLKDTYGLSSYYAELYNHKLQYYYKRLGIYNTESFGSFGKKYNEIYDNMVSKISKIYEKYGAILISDVIGGCGDWNDEVLVLNESLCEEYHLTCDRW